MADNTLPQQPQLFDPQSGAPVAVSVDQIPQAISSGKATFAKGVDVPMVDANGTAVAVPSEEAARAFSQGFKYEPLESQQGRSDSHLYGDGFVNPALAAAAGAARGLTFGASDPLLTASGAVDPETLRKLKEYNPALSSVSEVGGAVLPAVATMGGSAEAEGLLGAGKAALGYTPAGIANTVGRAATTGLESAMVPSAASGLARHILAKAVPAAAGSAIEGAMYGAGQGLSEHALGDPELVADKVAAEHGLGALIGQGALTGAITGGVIGGAMGTAGGVIGNFLKKTGEHTAGAEQAAVTDAIREDAAKAAQPAAPGSLDEIAQKVKEAQFQALNPELPAKQELLDAEKVLGDKWQYPAHRLELDALSGPHEWDEFRTLMETPNKTGKILSDYQAVKKQAGVSLLNSEIEGIAPGYKPAATAPEAGKRVVDALKTAYNAEKSELGNAFQTFDEVAGKTVANNNEVLGVVREAIPELERYITVEDGAARLEPFNAKMGITKPVYSTVKSVLSSLQDGPITASDVRNVRSFVSGAISPTASGEEKAALGGLKKSLMDYMQGLIERGNPEGQVRELFKRYAQNEERRGLAEYILGGKLDDHGQLRNAIVPENALKNLFSDSPTAEAAKKLMGPQKFNEALADFLSLQKQAVTDKGAFSSNKFNSFLRSNAPELEAAFHGAPDKLSRIRAITTIMRILPDAPSVNPSGSAKTVFRMLMGLGEAVQHPVDAVGGAVKHIGGKLEEVEQAAQINKRLAGNDNPNIAARVQSYIGLKNLEQKAAEVSRKIASSVQAFLSAGARAGTKALVPASVNYLSSNRLDSSKPERSKKARQEMYAKRFDEVSNAIANPDGLSSRIASNLSDMGQFAPNTAKALAQKAALASQFLYSKAPKDPGAGFGVLPHLKKWAPSDTELAKWERYATAVDHPMSVLHDMKKGMLTSEGVETLKAVYPKLYGEAVSQLTDHLTDLKAELPFQKRLQLSLFFGVPVDQASTPAFVQGLQAIHKAASSQQQPQAGGMAGSKKLNLAANSQTETEQLLTRT